VDLLSLALEAAYIVIFAASVVRFVRRPTRLNRDVLVAFAAYVAVFAIATLVAVVPALRPISPLAAVALVAQPYATVRLLRDFSPVPRRLEQLALVLFVTSAIAVVVLGTRHPVAITYIVVTFVSIEAVATIGFWRTSRQRVGAPRIRLALAALATAIFALTVFAVFAGLALAQGGPIAPEIVLLSRVGILSAGLGYLASFAPPASIRSFFQRASAFELTRDLVASSGSPDPTRLWDRLATTAGGVLGTSDVVVEQPGPGTPAARPAASTTLPIETRVNGRRVLRWPLGPAGSIGPTLVATQGDTPLFEEDDLALITLLGSITQQAVERDRILVELTDARASLGEAAAREASEIQFHALLDAEPNCVLVTDEDGFIEYANTAALRAFGYDATALRLLTVDDLVPPDGAGPQGSRRDPRAVRADGTTFPAELVLNPVRGAGRQLSIAVVSDISDRRAADEVRERFLDMLSHELRTPVTAIYGGSQLLLAREGRLDAATRTDVLTDIAAEAERLQRMVENLLILARVERGTDLGRSQVVHLSRLLPPLVERERQLWPNVIFNLAIAPGLPLVDGDDEYLAQILRNLLSNASKYGGAHGPIEIAVRARDADVAITVADRGPGFPPADAERLFDLYFRSEATSRVASGAGVGLFVCRKLAEAMGARLSAAPRDGGGAEFTLALAAYVDDDVIPSRALPRNATPTARVAEGDLAATR
jgi:PAS domain S-box-containing protein